jgi:integrase
VRGQARRLTLGQYPGVDLKLARERARDARAVIQRGEDPVERKKQEERDRQVNGFRSCVTEFVEKYAKPQQRTWKQTKRALDRLAVPVWGDRPVKEIRRRDVVELLDNVAKNTPCQANLLRAYLSRMFNWLIEREAVEVSPLLGVAPRTKPQPRSRILSDPELAALWKATAKLGGAFGAATRFLTTTGVRRDEASELRWDELDGDWAAMPGSRMKNGRDFRAPLSATAKTIVDSMPKLGEYVFTTTGKKPISGWGHVKARLDKLMSDELGEPVTEWRLHDLRRTLASGLARLGYRTEVIKRVLGHVAKATDVTSVVYNWHNYDAEAMEAVQKWAAHLAKLTTGLEVVESAAS